MRTTYPRGKRYRDAASTLITSSRLALVTIPPAFRTLNWRYGSLGCVFFPESKVVGCELQFNLLATTSTGCIRGREKSVAITKPENVRALESEGAFWLEPDGTKLKLTIRYL